MQTFLPYPSFVETAKCLDYRRLGKQRVECKQILQSLRVAVGGPLADKPSSWRNHPASKMWAGFEGSLASYAVEICREWRRRGYNDSLLTQFADVLRSSEVSQDLPPWLGDHDFHASHRSNLIRKLPEHYSQFGWSEDGSLGYVWPEPLDYIRCRS